MLPTNPVTSSFSPTHRNFIVDVDTYSPGSDCLDSTSHVVPLPKALSAVRYEITKILDKHNIFPAYTDKITELLLTLIGNLINAGRFCKNVTMMLVMIFMDLCFLHRLFSTMPK